jgi:septum formation protein
MFPLVLASASPWRQKLLADVGIAVMLHPSPADEDAITDVDPVARACGRAALKAAAVAPSHPDALVIGADQVAHLGGEAFGKPRDPDDHRRRLRLLRGQTHALVTAVTLHPGAMLSGRTTSPPLRAPATFTVETRLRFRGDTSDAELDAYVASGDGSGCAGGYRAEGPGALLIEGVEGDWFNVIGLPVFALVTELRRRGWCPAA